MIWLALYLLAILVCGFALSALLMGPKTRRLIDLIGSSIALGCAGLIVMLTWLSFTGVRPSRVSIIYFAAVAVMAIIIMKSRHRLPRIARPVFPTIQKMDLLALPAVALILIQLTAAGASAAVPVYEIDALAIWGLKAKALYFQPLSPTPEYFSDLSLSYSHLDYPLGPSMLWAGAYAMMQNVDDRLGKIVLLLPLFGLIAMLYTGLRDSLDRPRSLVLTAIAIGLPVTARYAAVGLVDITLAMFMLGAAASLVRWIRGGNSSDAIVAGILAATCCQIKLEGLIVLVSTTSIVIAAAIFGERRGWSSFVLAAAAVAAPWLVWSHGLPNTHENYSARLGDVASGLDRLPLIASLIIARLRFWAYGTPALFVLLAVAMNWRRFKDPAILAVWGIVLAQIAAYLAAYLVTPWDLKTLVPITFERLALHLLPLGMLIAALHWKATRIS